MFESLITEATKPNPKHEMWWQRLGVKVRKLYENLQQLDIQLQKLQTKLQKLNLKLQKMKKQVSAVKTKLQNSIQQHDSPTQLGIKKKVP